MKKTLSALLTVIAITCLATSSHAGFSVGGALSYAMTDASGTETDGTSTGASTTDSSTRTKSVDNKIFLGSLYAEYTFDNLLGVTLGAQTTPGSADVSEKTFTRTDTSEGKAADGDAAGASTFTAQAEVSNFVNYYIEVPVYGGLFVKAGHSSIDVETVDANTNTNHGTYGDKSLDGVNLGIGYKAVVDNLVWKIAYENTNFDTLKLTSTTNNTISADLDIDAINLTVGYQF